MRKILIAIFIPFLFLMSLSSTVTVKSIKSASKGKDIVIELSSTSAKPVYKTTYDSKNSLIFMEIENVPPSPAILKTAISDNFTESIKVVPVGKGTGIFIKHKKNLQYKITTKGNKITLSYGTTSIGKKYTIVIDPGHGGKDPGAVSGGANEKDIAFKVSNLLKDNLSKDFNVIMTRSTDIFIPLSDRPRVANTKKADMFISVHVNATTNSTAKGVEVFYYSKTSSPYAAKVAAYENSFGEKYGENVNDISKILGELEYTKTQEVSAKLAKNITDSLASGLNMDNRGIHGANFAVLRGLGRPNAIIPGVLVELGFITNSNDRTKLVNSSNQKIMADRIASQVREYFE